MQFSFSFDICVRIFMHLLFITWTHGTQSPSKQDLNNDVTSPVPIICTHEGQSPSKQDLMMSHLQYPLHVHTESSHPPNKTSWCHICNTHYMNIHSPVTLQTRPRDDVTSAVPITCTHEGQSPSKQDLMMSHLQYPFTWTHGAQSSFKQDLMMMSPLQYPWAGVPGGGRTSPPPQYFLGRGRLWQCPTQ